MRLQLIYPVHRPMRHRRFRQLVPPLGLAMVAACTPSDVTVGLTDQYLDEVRYTKGYDLVGLTGLTPNANIAYGIADRFRDLGVKVVIGGIHASSLPDEALEHADAVVVGEAEGIWPKVIEDFKAGRMRGVYRSASPPDLATIPHPRRDLWNLHRYIVKAPVETSRGCPFNCMYCSDSLIFGKKYRFRPVEDVVDEVRSIGRRYIFFVDNNIVGSAERAKRLFEALIPLRIRWTAQASITMAYDEELLKLAARSGCVAVLVGLETLKKDVLRDIGKPVDPGRYREYIERIQRHGIFVQGEFIFGFDEDGPSVFEETLRFAEEAKLGSARFAILKPYPGTRLFEKWKTEGRLVHTDWQRYHSKNVVFRPKQLTAEQLTAGRDWAYNRFATLRSIYKRVGFRRRHAGAIWLANIGNMLFKNSRST